MNVRTISVVTPCRNAERLVARTVESILGQSALRSGRLALEYMVCDGASTDRTVDIVREIAGARATVVSERDSGMYDALAKGLKRVTGDVVAYLNAGDVYFPTAFDTVADVFESNRARWLTGLKVLLNESGVPVRVSAPFRFRRDLIRRGAYGRLLPFIQQESTFWRRELLGAVDLARLSTMRVAGDHFLWYSFAEVEELRVVESLLGAFLVHRGQASEQMDAYRAEMAAVGAPLGVAGTVAALAEGAGWCAPPPLQRWMSRGAVLRWSGHDWR